MIIYHSDFAICAPRSHLRAGDAVSHPIKVLHDDDVLANVASLHLTVAAARQLAAGLIAAADAVEADPIPEGDGRWQFHGCNTVDLRRVEI